MSIFESLLLGLVQGLTEFLPVSSSGHLIIVQTLLGTDAGAADLMFDAMLHIGTLAAVIFVFRELIWKLIKTFFTSIPKLFTGKLKAKNATPEQRMIFFLIISLLPLFLILPVMDFVEEAYSSILLVGIALIVNAAVLFLSDRVVTGKKNASNMKLGDALVVGFTQAIAVIPGISRSGSTITAGVFCGFKRSYAAKYSFILSIPTILAGAFLKVLDVASEGGFNASLLPAYIVGTLAAAISGFAAIKLLQYLLKSRKFIIFAIYCLIVGVFSVIYGILA